MKTTFTVKSTHTGMTAEFAVSGCSFRLEDVQELHRQWKDCNRRHKISVQLLPEPQNPHDPHAVKVRVWLRNCGWRQIGYVPKDLALHVRSMLTNCYIELPTTVSYCGDNGTQTGNIGVHVSMKIHGVIHQTFYEMYPCGEEKE